MMLIVNVLAVIVSYVLIASWAYKRGRRMLVKCAAAFLALLIVVAMAGAPLFEVPTTPQLFLYVLLIGAPIVIMPTWLLLLLYSNRDRKAEGSAIGPIPIAAVGAAVGFVLGYMLTIVVFP
jgi:hypothetical protein